MTTHDIITILTGSLLFQFGTMYQRWLDRRKKRALRKWMFACTVCGAVVRGNDQKSIERLAEQHRQSHPEKVFIEVTKGKG